MRRASAYSSLAISDPCNHRRNSEWSQKKKDVQAISIPSEYLVWVRLRDLTSSSTFIVGVLELSNDRCERKVEFIRLLQVRSRKDIDPYSLLSIVESIVKLYVSWELLFQKRVSSGGCHWWIDFRFANSSSRYNTLSSGVSFYSSSILRLLEAWRVGFSQQLTGCSRNFFLAPFRIRALHPQNHLSTQISHAFAASTPCEFSSDDPRWRARRFLWSISHLYLRTNPTYR